MFDFDYWNVITVIAHNDMIVMKNVMFFYLQKCLRFQITIAVSLYIGQGQRALTTHRPNIDSKYHCSEVESWDKDLLSYKALKRFIPIIAKYLVCFLSVLITSTMSGGRESWDIDQFSCKGLNDSI